MKLKESLAAKIAAIILSYVMVLALAISVGSTAVMGYFKFYFSGENAVKQEILSIMADSEANYINSLLEKETDLNKYYKDKNVYFRVEYVGSDVAITNRKDEKEPLIATGSSEYYIYEEYEYEKYGEIYWDYREEHIASIEVYIPEEMTKNDMFSVTAKVIEIGYSLRFAMIFIALASLTALIVLLCFLYCAAGHRSGGVITRNYLDLLPFDIFTAIVVAVAIFSVILVDSLTYDIATAVLWISLFGTLDYFVALGYTLSFATRVKTRTLIKNNLIYYILSFFGRKAKRFFKWIWYILSNISLVYKTAIAGVVFVIAEIIGITIASNYRYYWGYAVFAYVVIFFGIILILALLYLAITLQKIKTGGEKIAKGDLQYKIDTKYMFGDFKEFCGSLNNINEGLQSAVNEKMKSERFKTELITNVSHDIKTPLTSIINYVDLVKKENIENETAKQYIEVLDRQSGRLKKLVEDLVEASKASTGNLSVSLVPCDVGVLLLQTLGEFEEKLRKANIYPVLKQPEKSVKIMADGRHLWRVFDNLMNNVCKYAQPETRVYLDVKEIDSKAVITFRNISKYELNISSEELMERFVRGDSSRNTEGSGLGLSIARSLVELQGGKMELLVDGDLFKVTVAFDLLGE